MKPTLLVVDDDRDLRELYAEALRGEGFEVIEAGTGIQGVALARSHHPDLILMDVSMPGMNGIDATARLKAEAETRDIPVIAVTAISYDDRKSHTFDAFLAKPITINRLVREVRNYLTPAAA